MSPLPLPKQTLGALTRPPGPRSVTRRGVKVRVGMILDTPRGFPPDIRVEKEARALCAAGFDVALLCARGGAGQPATEACDCGLTVDRVSLPPPTLRSRARDKIRFLASCVPVHEEWVGPLRAFVRSRRPHVLHCHDLTIVPSALRVAGESGLPVVADLHENMPAAQAAYVAGASRRKRVEFALTLGYRRWRWGEKRALRQCDRILVVCPEASTRLVRDYGIAEDAITVVSNTEDDTTFPARQAPGDILARYRNAWVASYIGGIGPHRGIDTAIRAAAIAGRRIPGFRLVIVGVRGAARERLARMACDADAAEHIELVDWVPPHQVPDYIAASCACLVPHNGLEHTQTTVPHKLFQYMLMGKPVVVSNCAPLERIVEETEAGLVFRAGCAGELADRLVALHRNEGGCAERYGANGRRAALGPYAWRHDARRLVDLYHDLMSERVPSVSSADKLGTLPQLRVTA